MKSKSENSGEYTAFEQALDKVLKVSHSDMQEQLKAEKKKPTSKRASSDHVSGDKS